MLAVPFQVCSQCFIEWSLARSLVLRDVGVLSSLLSLKNSEVVRGGLEIFFRSHRSSLLIIIGYQYDGVFVLVPLVPRCAVGDVDRREVVQVPTIIFCPSMNFLRLSIRFVTLPSEHDGIVIVLSRSWASLAFQWSFCHRASPCRLPFE